jgi:hypothetical protein
MTDQPPQAILWSPPDQTWIYAAAVAAQRHYDDQYQETVRPVDREAAEEIARMALNTDLPDETMLVQMCQDSKTTDLIWSPRRS